MLELLPSRQAGFAARRDLPHHGVLAGHGYAAVGVDPRGSGDSDGVLSADALERELRDAQEVIAWLAGRPWCDGRVGLLGSTWAGSCGGAWGGTDPLQVAARRPPGLAAVVTVCPIDDRYTDAHYPGGCLLSDNLSRAAALFAATTCPPDPEVVGERWRRLWHERMTGSALRLDTWLRHQDRDDYWRGGSACEDYAAVEVPVYAVCGWGDGHPAALLRLLGALDVPRKGLIGPWPATRLGPSGAAGELVGETLRWWDRWLRDVDNGVTEEPMLRVWMPDGLPPALTPSAGQAAQNGGLRDQRAAGECAGNWTAPGRWVSEPRWPSPRVREQELTLSPHRINRPDEHGLPGELTVESPLSVGQLAGTWCSPTAPPDLPYDQREEDGGSLVFDSDPLPQRCEILGVPVLELTVAASAPVAMVAARLSALDRDGRAVRIGYGLLNLTHRAGHADPDPLVPARRYRVELELGAVAQALAPGHRLRLAISTSYWPLAWPPPRRVRLSVFPEGSLLRLPVRDPAGAPPDPPDLADLAGSGGTDDDGGAALVTRLRPGEASWTVSRDLVDYQSALDVVRDSGLLRFEPSGLEVAERVAERYGWAGDNLTSTRGETLWSIGLARGDWRVRTDTRTLLTCTPDEFRLHAQLDAYEGDVRVHSGNWHHRIPRRCL